MAREGDLPTCPSPSHSSSYILMILRRYLTRKLPEIDNFYCKVLRSFAFGGIKSLFVGIFFIFLSGTQESLKDYIFFMDTQDVRNI